VESRTESTNKELKRSLDVRWSLVFPFLTAKFMTLIKTHSELKKPVEIALRSISAVSLLCLYSLLCSLRLLGKCSYNKKCHLFLKIRSSLQSQLVNSAFQENLC